MTSVGAEAATPDPADLTELSVTQLLAEIGQDHATATLAGKTQGERLDLMGRKAAEVHNRGGITWRQLADESGVTLRTLYRYAKPYIKPRS
jgi:hypothetical protein